VAKEAGKTKALAGEAKGVAEGAEVEAAAEDLVEWGGLAVVEAVAAAAEGLGSAKAVLEEVAG